MKSLLCLCFVLLSVALVAGQPTTTTTTAAPDPVGCYAEWTCTQTPQVFWTGTTNCPEVAAVIANAALDQVLVYSDKPNQLYSVQGSDGSSCTESATFGNCASSTQSIRTDGVIAFSDCQSHVPECAFTNPIPTTSTWNVDQATSAGFSCTTCFSQDFPVFGVDAPAQSNDIISETALSQGDTYENCAVLCATTPGCVQWVYSYPDTSGCNPEAGGGPIGVPYGYCWVKNFQDTDFVEDGCRAYGNAGSVYACTLNTQQVTPDVGFPGKRESNRRAIQNLLNLNRTNPHSIPPSVWKIVSL